MIKGLRAPAVCVVLLNWNGAEFTIPCVESLKESDYSNFQILVVDDGSIDDSPLRIAQRFPDLELLSQPANLGVSQARNRGIARAAELGSDYVLILDNDTKVDRSLISHLVATAKAHQNAVAVGPKIYYLHDPKRLWFAYGRLSLWTGFYFNPVCKSVDRGQFEQVMEMDAASSCCLLIPMGIVKVVGGFDPGFTRNEDLDWSLRCRRAGFRLLYCPQGKVWHFLGGSSRKQPAASIRYLLTRNQLWTLRKVGRPWHLLSILCFYPVHCCWRLLKMGLRKEWDCMWAELRGAKDGFLASIPPVDTPRGRLSAQR
ncbi:MAG: glycosyltransferase family 2 protein [Terriglobia bacterium]|jgi:hypothetical protein